VPTIQEQRNNQNSQAFSPSSSLRLKVLAQASSLCLGESSSRWNSGSRVPSLGWDLLAWAR